MITPDMDAGRSLAESPSSLVDNVEETTQRVESTRHEFKVPRVPGSSAGVYVGRKLFNSALRYLLNSSSGLGMFARSCFGFSGRDERPTEQSSGGFPIPLPYPEVCTPTWKADPIEVSRKKMLTAVVVGLNYLHLNRPTAAPSSIKLGRPLSRSQWGIVRQLELFMDAWLRHNDVGPTDMGRTAPKVESIEEMIRLLTDQAQKVVSATSPSYFPAGRDDVLSGGGRLKGGAVVGKLDHSPYSTFKPVEPDRLKFIGRPNFDPLPFLDPQSAFVYKYPLQAAMAPEDFNGQIPFVQVHCSKDVKLKLFSLLDQSGRLALHPAASVRPKFASGLFAVLKDEKKDRLIMDSRPSNCLEKVEQRWVRSLAVGESLCRLSLQQDEVLRTSSNDLRDYYYLFQISQERSRRNILCGSVSPDDVRHLSCYRSEFDDAASLYGSLNTLAMGDTHAVGLAQTCHLSMAVQAKVASSDNLFTLSGPTPRGPHFVGIVIDDFVSMAAVKKNEKLPTMSGHLAEHMHTVYESVELIPHKDKAFRDELQCTVWGTDIDGERGLIRGSLKRAIPLLGIIFKISSLGYSTVELLQIISGSLVSLFLFRRRLLSVLDSIFDACKERNGKDVVKLSGRLKGELLICGFLLPMACTNIRAKHSGRITATDASHWGEAAVCCDIPEVAAREIARHSIRKSVWTRLLPPGKAWARGHNLLEPQDELPDDECYKSNPLWEALASSLPYHLLYKEATKGPRHINIGEVRAMLKAEKMHASRTKSAREIYGMDSQVGLGALTKGRSASPSLNLELSKSVPTMLGKDMYSDYLYYETSINPSDAPTRGKSVPSPSRSLPSWWLSFCSGDFCEFDQWRDQHRLGDFDLSGLPSFSEIDGSQSSSIPTSDTASGCQVPVFADVVSELETFGMRELSSQVDAEGSKQIDSSGAAGNVRGATRQSDLCYAVNRTPVAVGDTNVAESEPCGGRKAVRDFREKFQGLFGKLSLSDAEFALDFLNNLDANQVPKGSTINWPPTRPGYLDLFSGEKGVALCMIKGDYTWAVTYDIAHGTSQDLNSPAVRSSLERLLRCGIFFCAGMAPVCSSFSVAITPPVRTLEHPEGIPNVSEKMQVKIAEGNDMCCWVLQLCLICLRLNILFWVENPGGSWFFRQKAWLKMLDEFASSVGFWVVDYCRYGTQWRKRTKICSNSVLKNIKTLCDRTHRHLALRGRSKLHRKSWTLVAQPYPSGVCRAIAEGIKLSRQDVGERGGFDPSRFCRCSGRRIGEADHPGPNSGRQMSLDDVKLVEAKTLALQSKVWRWFCLWLVDKVGEEVAGSIRANPALLCLMVQEFGDHLYSHGKALYLLRHLVVLVQQEVFGARSYISCCWDRIRRWEVIEPPRHRVPLPYSVLQAMVTLSVFWGWSRFACTLCISFFGITRPGEVLRARRFELVLPRDLMTSETTKAYLQVSEPKSRRRSSGRVQHASIEDSHVVKFITRVFGSLDESDFLYLITGGSFRRRWDRLAEFLGIHKSLKLTPGCLRSGGCVYAYRQGQELQKILWRMRLRQLQTLENYLQEVATDAFLHKLSASTKRKILLLSELFGPTLSAVTSTERSF